jgi:glutamate-1-semialdehyde aminotransferase
LNAKGERLRSGLRAAAKKADLPIVVLGDGSLTSINLTNQTFDSYRDMVSACGPRHREKMYVFHRAMLNAGILVAPQGTFVGSTPMADADIDATIAAAEQSFAALARESPPGR